jgi:predicted small metal-binding protein
LSRRPGTTNVARRDIRTDDLATPEHAKIPCFPKPNEAAAMARKYIDCREIPSESKCTVAISADSDKELMDVAVQHAVKVHGHQDTPEFRQMLKQAMKEGSPPP